MLLELLRALLERNLEHGDLLRELGAGVVLVGQRVELDPKFGHLGAHVLLGGVGASVLELVDCLLQMGVLFA